MRAVLFAFSILANMYMIAQEESSAPTEPKTQVIYPTSGQFDIWDLRFGHASMIPATNDFGLNYFSFNFAAHYLYEFNLSLKRNFSFALGFGYDFQRNHLNGYFKTSTDESTSFFNSSTSSRTNVHSISVPAELRFRINQKWKIYFGYQALLPFKSVNKYTLEGNDDTANIQSVTLPNHGAFLRVGYKDFFLFTRLNFSPSFITKDHQRIRYLQFGISLGG